MVVMLTNDLLEGRLNIIIRQRFKFNKRNKNQGATGPVGIISDNELLGMVTWNVRSLQGIV